MNFCENVRNVKGWVRQKSFDASHVPCRWHLQMYDWFTHLFSHFQCTQTISSWHFFVLQPPLPWILFQYKVCFPLNTLDKWVCTESSAVTMNQFEVMLILQSFELMQAFLSAFLRQIMRQYIFAREGNFIFIHVSSLALVTGFIYKRPGHWLW